MLLSDYWDSIAEKKKRGLLSLMCSKDVKGYVSKKKKKGSP